MKSRKRDYLSTVRYSNLFHWFISEQPHDKQQRYC